MPHNPNPPQDLSALVTTLGQQLQQRRWMLASAESCTGGLIAAACTDIAGSSRWFERGFVTYSNAAKTQLLGVPAELIATHGAVSEPVARAMAHGAALHAQVPIAVASTGIAGPDGGSPDKPVGTVWLAVAGPGAHDTEQGEGVVARRILWPGEREQVRRVAAYAALNLLREILSPPEHPLLGEERSF